MSTDRVNYFRAALVWVPALAAMGFGLWYALDWTRQNGEGGQSYGTLELDQKSEYSRIKVTRFNNTRTLWFVRDNGDEVIESTVDLKNPHDLLVEYTRFM